MTPAPPGLRTATRKTGCQLRSGNYRVNFRMETTTACYTDNLEDAVNTAVEMARTCFD